MRDYVKREHYCLGIALQLNDAVGELITSTTAHVKWAVVSIIYEIKLLRYASPNCSHRRRLYFLIAADDGHIPIHGRGGEHPIRKIGYLYARD